MDPLCERLYKGKIIIDEGDWGNFIIFTFDDKHETHGTTILGRDDYCKWGENGRVVLANQ